MNKETVKQRVCEEIDRHAEEIRRIGRDISGMAELGYKEEKTSAYIRQEFDRMNLEHTDHLGVTGIKARLKGKSSAYQAAIIGEMDAVKCDGHPDANPQTGAAHACGHHAQSAMMLGAAMGLYYSEAWKYLDGDVVFMAMPAEEFVELDYRKSLKQKGLIRCCSGKQEWITRGYFDGIDAAMMVHSHAGTPGRKAYLNGSSSAFLAMSVRFRGKEAHAGGAPHEGINALNAAMASMMCMHALRETFRDEDKIRVHPILTKGGDLVNIVPADVRMEMYVRGATMEAVRDAAAKVKRAIQGASYAIGATAEIEVIPGYQSLEQNQKLSALFRENLVSFIKEEDICEGVDLIGSTDMGDLSGLIPVIQPTMGGYEGSAHSEEFRIVDEEMAYLIPAKALAMTAVDLLWDNGKALRDVKEQFQPRFTREEYEKVLQDTE